VEDEADIEMQLLLEGIYAKYGYDFRQYATASLRRRLTQALRASGLRSLSEIQERILRDPAHFQELLRHLTVQVSEMFRDPAFFRAVRTEIVPLLRTYPSLRLWIAGCSGGEELYAFAILLLEEGLLDRTTLYASDINPWALRKAEAGIFDLDRLAQFSDNHIAAGGKASLSEYYIAAYGSAVFDKALRRNVVFTDHSLATDHVFAEVQLVSCRNVLIYFDRGLQNRAMALFEEALCPHGFLCLGARETVRFSANADAFTPFRADERIFRKRGVR
jgi:chemotaxis protein methyltransferase CheR